MSWTEGKAPATVAALAVGFLGASPGTLWAREAESVAERQEVSQYGITWKFGRKHRTGRFATGDWCVVGPARIVSVDPAPGPAPGAAEINPEASRKRTVYGVTSHRADYRMVNGSMIVLKCGGRQGYDFKTSASSMRQTAEGLVDSTMASATTMSGTKSGRRPARPG